MKTFSSVVFKNKKLIFVLAIIGLLSGALVNSNWKEKYSAEIFFTVGLHADSVPTIFDKKNLFNLSREADDFVYTVRGWLLFPDIQKKIITKAGLTQEKLISIKTKKQERQNLITFIKSNDAESANKLAKATLQVVQEELSKYEKSTKRVFRLTNTSYLVKPLTPKATLNLVTGFLLGTFIGLFIVYIKEVYKKYRQYF